jgi:hypothetical protein
VRASNRLRKFRTKSKYDYDGTKHQDPWSCVFCGKKMHIIKEVGNHVWWSCDTEDCIGNLNTKRKRVSNKDWWRDKDRMGNVSKLWARMKPIV